MPEHEGSPKPIRIDTDRALIDRAAKGDTAAFQELFRLHRADVSRAVFRMLGPRAEVEDVVQEVFLHLFRSLPSFRGESRFSTWLYRLSINVARMHLRRARSRPKFADVEVPDRADDHGGLETPEQCYEQRERIRALYRLLESLTEKKREVLVLHDLEGTAPRDISEMLGIPVLTVRTRLFYARKELYAAMSTEPEMAAEMRDLVDLLPGRVGARTSSEQTPRAEPGKARRRAGTKSLAPGNESPRVAKKRAARG